MSYNSDKEAIEVITAFEESRIPRDEWTHAAYLLVGLHYCIHFPREVALHKMRVGVRRLNKANGVRNTPTTGYHETMTVFWVTAIKQFLKTSGQGTLSELANGLIDKYNDPRLPLRYYSRSLLFSPEARQEYVRPDRDEADMLKESANYAARVGGFTLTQFA